MIFSFLRTRWSPKGKGAGCDSSQEVDSWSPDQANPLSPVTLPHFPVGGALLKRANGCLRLPSDISLREAKVKVVEIGPHHKFLAKR